MQAVKVAQGKNIFLSFISSVTLKKLSQIIFSNNKIQVAKKIRSKRKRRRGGGEEDKERGGEEENEDKERGEEGICNTDELEIINARK